MSIAGMTMWVGDTFAFVGEFPGAVGSTFLSGEAYDSLCGALNNIVDTMTFGVTDLTSIPPLYGNTDAYESGQSVGYYWGVANWLAIGAYRVMRLLSIGMLHHRFWSR
ncbi:MAG: hypothetical protein WKF77_11715 [Planctomycetaceae bacterium]